MTREEALSEICELARAYRDETRAKHRCECDWLSLGGMSAARCLGCILDEALEEVEGL